MQECRVVGGQIVLPSGNHPDDLVPILMSDAFAVFGYAPKRCARSLRAKQIGSIGAIEGAIAGPLASVVSSGKDDTFCRDVFVESLDSHIKSLIDGGIVGGDCLRGGIVVHCKRCA